MCICRDIQIQINSSYVNDDVAAEAFSKQFAGNFNEKTQSVLTDVPKHDATLASFNCNESDIFMALKSCPCSNTSINGISFKVLKPVAGHIIYPLNVIFQHSSRWRLPIRLEEGGNNTVIQRKG